MLTSVLARVFPNKGPATLVGGGGWMGHEAMVGSDSGSISAILEGLVDGYCGCLTTVSTFAVEVGALKTRRAWVYVLLSWGVSQLLLLVIMGTSWWAGGIDEENMCSFATN